MGRTRVRTVGTAATVSLVALLVLLGVMSTAVGAPGTHATTPASAAASGQMIGVTDEFQFQPNGFEVATPGANASLTIVQMGSTPHTFTLFSVTNFSFDPAANTTTQIDAFIAAHPPLVNVNISGTAGSSVTVDFKAPKFGVYQFVCLEPGHFQRGMEGFMGSGEPPPGVSVPSTGPGAPVFIISGAIASLLVIAIVLGFVVGRRRGSMHEMPPERLGYAEPIDPGTAEALPSSPKPPNPN